VLLGAVKVEGQSNKEQTMKKILGVSLNLEIAIIAACGLGIVPGIVWGLIAGTATSPR
jgi:hypothetical protein